MELNFNNFKVNHANNYKLDYIHNATLLLNTFDNRGFECDDLWIVTLSTYY